jgi:hypothetical protein
MSGARRLRQQDEEITQKLDLALERLQAANARQHRARERIGSDPPPKDAAEAELEQALDAGSGPRHVVG